MSRQANEEHQRLLDNDPAYQKMMDEQDQSWWHWRAEEEQQRSEYEQNK